MVWPLILAMGVSAIASARETKLESAYKQARGRANARISRQQADDAIVRGQSDVIRSASAAKSLLGAQRAALGAQGVDIDSGSAADVQADTAQQQEVNARLIRNNAVRESWGFEMDAMNSEFGADLAQRAGRAAVASTLLSSGVSIGSAYYNNIK